MPEATASKMPVVDSTRLHGFLLVVGPDGAGKTTVVEALTGVVTTAGVPVQRRHSRPGLIGGRAARSGPVTDPHAQAPRSPWGAALKLAVVFADHLLGGHLRWARMRRRGLLVVERGWVDMHVDPRRYRLPVAARSAVAPLTRLLPRPDLVVLLGGDPARLHQRKPEIGEVEVSRQLQAWRDVAHRAGRRVLELDTTRTHPAESVRRIVDTLSSRQDRTLRWRAVPLTAPRLALQTCGHARPAVRLYEPFSPRARAGLHVGTVFQRLGRRVCAPVPELEALLADLGLVVSGAVAMRSSHQGRLVVGICQDRRLDVVLKVGPADDAALRREARMLSVPLRPQVARMRPQLLWSGEWGDRFAMATRAVERRSHHRWGVEELLPILGDLGSAGLDGSPLTHGDVAPWNLVRTSSGPVLLDWESARFSDEPLFDLVHFLVQSGSLLGRPGAAECLRLLCDPSGPASRLLEQRRGPGDDARDHVHRHLSAWAPADKRARRFREDLLALLTA